jgi:hypothetical protein
MTIVNFVVHHVLPVFQVLFFAGLIGSVPVILITAVKTAQSLMEGDTGGPDQTSRMKGN